MPGIWHPVSVSVGIPKSSDDVIRGSLEPLCDIVSLTLSQTNSGLPLNFNPSGGGGNDRELLKGLER